MIGMVEHRDFRRDVYPLKYNGSPHINPPPPPPSISSQTVHPVTDEVDNNDYRFEAARLESFRNWPIPYMSPARLAAAGFYYTGEGDKVKCFECQTEICQWLEDDDPMVDHQRWGGRCRFIRRIPCGNVPIGVDPSTVPPPRPRSRDVCGPYGIDYRPDAEADCHTFQMELLPSNAKLGCLGLGRPNGPNFPEYASYDARLRTFDTWPKSMPQSKEELANAGFYYTGKGDQTLCYHCGGGLKDWEPDDNPWEQHAKWFSKCYYLLLNKGQDYVNKVTGKQVTPPSKEETMQMNLPSFIKKVEQPATATETEEMQVAEHPSSSAASSSSTCSQESGIESLASGKGSLEDLTLESTPSSSNKPIDDARMCKICYNGELGVVFLPCGHIVACVKCAPGMTTCAVCRKHVTMTVRAFFS